MHRIAQSTLLKDTLDFSNFFRHRRCWSAEWDEAEIGNAGWWRLQVCDISWGCHVKRLAIFFQLRQSL
jgi:hypothetical protein